MFIIMWISDVDKVADVMEDINESITTADELGVSLRWMMYEYVVR